MKPIVSVSWLYKNLNNTKLVILDASTESNAANLDVEFPGIQIKSACHFDFKNIITDKKSNLPNTLPSPQVFEKEVRKLGINRDSQIVVYDNLGVYASPRVWWMFKIMGHENIVVLDGGLNEWKKHNYPCEPLQRYKAKTGNFTANFHPKLIRNAQQILENIRSNNEIIIDARSKERFYGTKPEARKNLKSGHIPNSFNLPFSEVLKDGKFLSEEELLRLFNKINPEKSSMIFTCGSGVSACILQLAAKLIGYNKTSIYDGSWTEWGQGEQYPIVK